jgi:hypothetical protein
MCFHDYFSALHQQLSSHHIPFQDKMPQTTISTQPSFPNPPSNPTPALHTPSTFLIGDPSAAQPRRRLVESGPLHFCLPIKTRLLRHVKSGSSLPPHSFVLGPFKWVPALHSRFLLSPGCMIPTRSASPCGEKDGALHAPATILERRCGRCVGSR